MDRAYSRIRRWRRPTKPGCSNGACLICKQEGWRKWTFHLLPLYVHTKQQISCRPKFERSTDIVLTHRHENCHNGRTICDHNHVFFAVGQGHDFAEPYHWNIFHQKLSFKQAIQAIQISHSLVWCTYFNHKSVQCSCEISWSHLQSFFIQLFLILRWRCVGQVSKTPITVSKGFQKIGPHIVHCASQTSSGERTKRWFDLALGHTAHLAKI